MAANEIQTFQISDDDSEDDIEIGGGLPVNLVSNHLQAGDGVENDENDDNDEVEDEFTGTVLVDHEGGYGAAEEPVMSQLLPEEMSDQGLQEEVDEEEMTEVQITHQMSVLPQDLQHMDSQDVFEDDNDVPLPPLPGGDDNNGDGQEDDDEDDDDDDDYEDGDEDDDNEVAVGGPVEGAYDPAHYENLDVEPEIKELFTHILKYTPQPIELETKFRPFIPDYIPAVGDIDAFIRVCRPDDKPEMIGLKVVGEPSAKQADPNLLELQLRVITKQSAGKTSKIKKIETSDTKELDKWVRDISDLHRSKPNPTVNYSKPMPDIDTLMQEWPEDMEGMLGAVGLPTSDLNADVATIADLMCGLLDIPVYRNRVQSLHVLFSLYSAFRSAEHFGHLGGVENGQFNRQLNYNSNVLQLDN